MKSGKFRVIHSCSIWLLQTQTWIYTQVKYLPDAAEVHVVCERTVNLDQFSVPNIHCQKSTSLLQFVWEKAVRKIYSPHYRGYLKAVANKTSARILHSHFGPLGWLETEVARELKISHVVTFYGYDVKMLPRRDDRWLSRYRELFESADLFLCEGPHMARAIIELGCPEQKVKVHHLGVEIDGIAYKPRCWRDGEPLRVLIAAGFREKKGIPYALQALAQLQRDLPLEITIIGDADPEEVSKSEKERILEIIEASGLKSKTRLLGYQPYSKLFQEAYNHHIFISPSVTAANGDTEGGAPVTLIEMMATGMPVISTLHCDIPEVVQYGVKDWLVEERDVPGLVDRLRWLVQHADKWPPLLAAGRRHVELEYDAADQGRKLVGIYQNLMKQ